MRNIVPVLLLGLLMAGCQLIDPEREPVKKEQVRLVSDPLDVAAAEGDDHVELESAYIRGNTLFLEVGYSGGCAPHDFELFASNEGLHGDDPPRVEVALSHDDRGDDCEAFLHRTLEFDLNPLRRYYRDDADGSVRLLLYAPGHDPDSPGDPDETVLFSF